MEKSNSDIKAVKLKPLIMLEWLIIFKYQCWNNSKRIIWNYGIMGIKIMELWNYRIMELWN